MKLSPDGRTLAWLLGDRASLWTSHVDGSAMRLIDGAFPAHGPDYDEESSIALHGWYPDSRAVLLEVRKAESDKVYRVPIR